MLRHCLAKRLQASSVSYRVSLPSLTPCTRYFALSTAKMSTSKQSEKTPVFHSIGLPLHMSKAAIDLTVIQLGQTSSDKGKNIEHARDTITRAVQKREQKGKGSQQIVMLPECWNSPYGVQYFDKYAEDFGGAYEQVKCPLDKSAKVINAAHVVQEQGVDEAQAAKQQQDALVKRWTVDGLGGRGMTIDESNPSETLRMMSKLAKELEIILVGGSIPERDTKTGNLYNTATVFDETGKLISMHRKLHLFDIDIPGKMTFQESKTLTGGDRITVFECSLGRFGLAICYDLRFPEAATVAARLGAGAMLYPGAFNTTTGPRSWELLQRARAADNQLYVASCSPARPSQADIEAGSYPTYGFSMLVDPWGQVVTSLAETESVLETRLERSAVEEGRTFVPTSRQRRFDVYADIAGAQQT